MFKTDFSRLKELFLEEPNSSSNNLAEIIRLAFKQFLKIKNLQQKKISFGTIDLFVIKNNGKPDLKEFRIKGHTKSFNEIIQLLDGQIEAYFSNLKLEHLRKAIQRKIVPTQAHSCVNTLNFFLSSQNINKVSTSTISKQSKEDLKKILCLADRIVVQNQFYLENDPNKDLINEFWTISKDQDYFVEYSIKKAIGKEPLYLSLFSRIERIFNLIKFENS